MVHHYILMISRTASSQDYLAKRAALIDLSKTTTVHHGDPEPGSDTIYLATADKEGNACSLMASNYGCKSVDS